MQELQLSDEARPRRRSAPSQTSFAAARPDDAILAHAGQLAERVRQGRWEEAVAVLKRYSASLGASPLPPALEILVSSACLEAADDGAEAYEGYARRFLALVGAKPWASSAVARSEGGKLHLLDPSKPRRAVCGSRFQHLGADSRVARGHFRAALERGAETAGAGVCRRCAKAANEHPGALESSWFPVLEPGERARLEQGLRAGLLAGAKRGDQDLEQAAAQGLVTALCGLAAPRLAAAEWEPLRKRLFGARLRLGGPWRDLYGGRGSGPGEAEWRLVLAALPAQPELALLERSGPSGLLFDLEEQRYASERLDELVLVPGLLARCYPELLELVERELEGEARILAGLSPAARERARRRLRGCRRRAVELRPGRPGRGASAADCAPGLLPG